MDSKNKTAIKAPIDSCQYNCMDKQDLGDVGEERTINTNLIGMLFLQKWQGRAANWPVSYVV